jgi:hypothetical protein
MLRQQNLIGCVIALALATVILKAAPANETISVTLSRARAQRGDRVEATVRPGGAAAGSAVQAVLFTPLRGATSLPLQSSAGGYRAEIPLASDAPEGLYTVHAWTGDMASPAAVGKASFLLGRVVTDFLIAAYLDEGRPAADLDAYLKDFRQVGGNLLIAHNLITTQKAYFPSRVCRTDVARGSDKDRVELILSRADREGFGVLLSVSWDMTRNSHFKDRMKEIKAITDELYALYRHHPSLAGFYSYQEGSGTYFAPYVREFSQHVKSLQGGLLTACAPHVDDPLLAGYLSAIEELDVIIYQTGVMASYRTDNRKKYPLRRVRDFCSLGAGAKRLQNKIAITHVELFGYLENRISPDHAATSYENIYPQILSAATVAGADGISLFSYHAHVYEPLKKDQRVARSRAAVADGLKAFALITSQISRESNPLAVYFPYSDWIIERWPNYFLPALDAFRALGAPVDVLPYAPPLEESVYPYYPFHLNKDVLARLLRERTTLVLPNVSGFQQTDSDLIKAFVEQGGVVVAFGPQIPMGRSYERRELFGGEELEMKPRASLTVTSAVGQRAHAGSRYAISAVESPSWKAIGAQVIASFDDGSAAAMARRFGNGLTVTFALDALTVAKQAPELARDVIDYALKAASAARAVEILGANENVDLAVKQTASGFRAAVVNHNNHEMEVTLRPLAGTEGRAAEWIDMISQRQIEKAEGRFLKLRVPRGGVRCVEFRRAAPN